LHTNTGQTSGPPDASSPRYEGAIMATPSVR
jgi:hypothetical protein